ncbi:MAG TPA: hypothetical protein VE196_02800, partial [Pseudonocardiaceae bacterium]|nr:hypothetical protein [Pseudonocardiaceae bacterium]
AHQAQSDGDRKNGEEQQGSRYVLAPARCPTGLSVALAPIATGVLGGQRWARAFGHRWVIVRAGAHPAV